MISKTRLAQLSPPPNTQHQKPSETKAKAGTTARLKQHAQQAQQQPLTYDACSVHDDHNQLQCSFPWPDSVPRVAARWKE